MSWLRTIYMQLGSSLATVFTLSVALIMATRQVESAADFTSTFNESTNQHLVELNFDPPNFVFEQQDGVTCARVVMRNATLEKTMGAPPLPSRPIVIHPPEGLSFKNYRVIAKTSEPQNLAYPLCVTPKLKIKESFRSTEKRATTLSLEDKSSIQVSLPFPKQPIMQRSLPSHGGGGNLYFLAYPVVAKGSHTVEVISKVIFEINYGVSKRRFGTNFKELQSPTQPKFSVPTTQSLRIKITAPGAYEINGALLNNFPPGTAASSIEVWRGNQQIPRAVVTSGANISAIRFLIPAINKTYYSDHEVLWIRSGSGGLDLASEDADPNLQTAGTSTHQQTDEFYSYSKSWNSLPISLGLDSENDPIPPGPKQGYAYQKLQYAPGPFSNVNYNFTPKSRVVNGTVNFYPVWRGVSYYPEEADHHVEVSLNGGLIGSTNSDDQALVTPTYSTVTTLIQGANSVSINIPGGIVSGFESIAFYGFDVTYPREMAAINNYTDFAVDNIASYTIKDFTSSSLLLYRLNDGGTATQLTNFTVTDQGDSTYHLNFSANQAGRYFAAATSAFKTPAEALLDTPSSLQNISAGAEYIVIAGHGLYSGAAALASYRQSMSALSTLTIDVQDIYDEFNYGVPHPRAIRDFLKDAYERWTTLPKYLVLVGDSTNDPLGLLAAGNKTNTKLVHYFDVTTFLAIPNDSRFGYLTSDGPVSDLAIGRIPITSNTQMDDYIDKLSAYENAAASSAWMNDIEIINDNFNEPLETWEQPFVDSMDWMQSHTPAAYQLHHIDLLSTDGAIATTQLTNDWNDGRLAVYYMGHGSTTMWSAESLLTSTSVGTLASTTPALPFVASMTCLTGTFTEPSTTSLAESLMSSNARGAIGVFASSGMTVPDAQAQFAETLFSYFYQYAASMGSIIRAAREVLEISGLDIDVAKSYNLFGDPALQLHFKGTQPLDSTDSNNDPDTVSTPATGGSGFFGCGAIHAPTTPTASNQYHLLAMLIQLMALASFWLFFRICWSAK